eukprot:CAMPEP_0182899422 /NCGR_PEP_ID=MMETSP0034_2-20130328/28065_1 /TAXON_ID=156128 /ORGANISM="Nephroselmis pyriformis, Strain CCMP717" /LENGTH=193 /DNA_ID=CAMNT_0025033451 /DNA_START=290 /DNA_END=872 /DNA_ORIENTATION=+
MVGANLSARHPIVLCGGGVDGLGHEERGVGLVLLNQRAAEAAAVGVVSHHLLAVLAAAYGAAMARLAQDTVVLAASTQLVAQGGRVDAVLSRRLNADAAGAGSQQVCENDLNSIACQGDFRGEHDGELATLDIEAAHPPALALADQSHASVGIPVSSIRELLAYIAPGQKVAMTQTSHGLQQSQPKVKSGALH